MIYAVAALFGAPLVVVADALGLQGDAPAAIGAVAASGLRLAAMYFGWNLPQR